MIINDISQLQIGDSIEILNRPLEWSCKFGKYPLNLDFPRTIIITDMYYVASTSNGYAFTAIGDENGYGWTLEAIIKIGCKLICKGVMNEFPFIIYEKNNSYYIKN